jgi:excinuclease UvrABC ATPase subunit
VVTIQDKAIVLADNPSVSMLSQLRTLANEGRTVVVTSNEETFLNMSDKIITLGEHDHIYS